MTCRQIDVGFVRRVTPDVVTHRRIHVLTRRVEIFFVALNLVDESGFRDGDSYFILLPARFGWRRGGIAGKGSHVTERLLPQFSMTCPRANSQLSQIFVG